MGRGNFHRLKRERICKVSIIIFTLEHKKNLSTQGWYLAIVFLLAFFCAFSRHALSFCSFCCRCQPQQFLRDALPPREYSHRLGSCRAINKFWFTMSDRERLVNKSFVFTKSVVFVCEVLNVFYSKFRYWLLVRRFRPVLMMTSTLPLLNYRVERASEQ